MASDSLFGGGGDGQEDGEGTSGSLFSQLDEGDRALLDALLADFSGGPAVDFDGGKLISGDGPGGEKQGALVPGSSDMDGIITNGDLTLEVDIPAGVGLTFSGKDGQTESAAENYLNTQIAGYFVGNVVGPETLPGDSSPEQLQQRALVGAVDDVLSSFDGAAKDYSVRVLDFPTTKSKTSTPQTSPLVTSPLVVSNDSDTFTIVGGLQPQAGVVPTKQILFDAGASKGKQIFAINMTKLGMETELVLKNVEGAVLAGPGNLRVDGTVGARINSDNFGQNVTGGGGNDTLVGGGNDTLTGGVGADIFGFTSTAKGNFTITDFNKTTDQIGLKLTGVTTFAQLQAAVTGGSYANGAMTYNLGPDISITLVGINPFDITADMIKFTY
ncbi:MAG: hypothetical protein AB7P37_16465 [Ramlibacter sp.]